MQLAACALLMFLSATAAPPTIQLERPAWKQEFDEANRAYKSGELAKAEQGFRKALISAKNGEKPELARAFVLNGLVAALVAREAYAEAEPLAAEAAELWTKTQGFEHPTVGRTYSNLGNIRRALKDFDGAESAYRQSLTCLNRVLPKITLTCC
jgi:tetratricopeptide (TPR) repeat protein